MPISSVRRSAGFGSILVVTAVLGALGLAPSSEGQSTEEEETAAGGVSGASQAIRALSWRELGGEDLPLDTSVSALVAAAPDAESGDPIVAEAPALLFTAPARPASDGGQVMAPMLAALIQPPPHPLGTEQRLVEVQPGDTLLAILARAEVPSTEAHAAVNALEEIYDLRRMQIGQEVMLTFEHDGRYNSMFTGLETLASVERFVRVERTVEGDFAAAEEANQLTTEQHFAAGPIHSSLYAATNGEGVPDAVLVEVIRAFSYDVDFQRDIRAGDGFELFYEMDYQPDGSVARTGDVLFANLILSGSEERIYLFESDDGSLEYYKPDGASVRRALLKTPVDGFRVSSGFGLRRHPILGYSRMHRGIDFAAPSGTPIYAAGDGVIDVIGPNSGYGNYVRIRHTGSMSTAYAHMSRFASGVSRGDRVQQGQVIGYVGSTGMSTGPHLHYEVLMNGSQVNPLDLDLPTGRELAGAELQRFQALVAEIDAQVDESREAAPPRPQLVDARISEIADTP